MSERSENIARALASMKGLAGSGNILSKLVSDISDIVMTMEPGDFVNTKSGQKFAAPVASDLWYLFYHDNFLKKYHADESADFKHYKYAPYLSTNLSFLSSLTGLKPLKIFADLDSLGIDEGFGEIIKPQYANNGMYWINTIAFEIWGKGISIQYASDGPKGFNPNDYVGYLSFPIGQLGVMEVISLLQETELTGNQFVAVEGLSTYWPKNVADLKDNDKPSLQSTPEMFPDAKNSNGNILSGQNYCYGRHLVENGYVVPDKPVPSQNSQNSDHSGAYGPTPSRDVELFSKKMEKYAETVEPKLWMRYWIHKDSTLPVPGEFIGILCRPVATPPHVWWFQESSPFLYAGNWLETGNLTSGIVTARATSMDWPTYIYKVKVQGVEVWCYTTDFYEYGSGDRVALVKLDTTTAKADKSFTWLDQKHLKVVDAGTVKVNYAIIPATFYKQRH